MKIVIVEDHRMFREVLHKVCTVDLGFEVVAEADDGRFAVDVIVQARPDLVLLDLHLPNLNGFGVIEEIRRALPYLKVLILSSHCDDFTVFQAERSRVNGFIDKNTNTVEALKTAIAAVAGGRVWFSDAFQAVKAARRKDPRSFDKLLTERERDVLTLLGASLADEDIAARLGISGSTVEKHRFNILKKLELRTTVELTRFAREHGFTLSSIAADPRGLLP